MQDMLVKLYNLPPIDTARIEAEGYQIRRAMAPDKTEVLEWVRALSGRYAAGECDVSFSRTPVSCFLATKGAQIVGYACYDATAPDFFGPTAVAEPERGKGLGKALMLAALHALKDEGYGYAIIGGVGPASFYEKVVGAWLIPESDPGIYKDFLWYLRKKEQKEEIPEKTAETAVKQDRSAKHVAVRRGAGSLKNRNRQEKRGRRQYGTRKEKQDGHRQLKRHRHGTEKPGHGAY